MLSTLIALTLTAGTAQADGVDDARLAYSRCLRDYMRTSLQQRVEPAAFETAVDQQCTDRATAYREALIRRDQRTGGGRARAEEDARMSMEDTKANLLEWYRDYYETETMPD